MRRNTAAAITLLLLVIAGVVIGLVAVAQLPSPVARRLHVPAGPTDNPVPAWRNHGTAPREFTLPNGNFVNAFWRPHRRDVPWVVFVHGGYWEYGRSNSSNIRVWGRRERARGFAAFSVSYRLVPHVAWPTPLRDVETAIAWIRARAPYFGLDLSRGFIVGHSAGGQLSSIAALDTGDFIGAVDISGAVDPLAEFQSASDEHLRTAALQLAGNTIPLEDPRRWEQMRAAAHIGRHKVPFLIMQSRDDHTVPFASSETFAAALAKHGYQVRLLPIAGSDHELDTAHDWHLVDNWIDGVLLKQPR